MKSRMLAALFAAGIVSFSQAAVQSTFYVSPTGTGDFSQANPGPLSGILAKVRTVNTNMTGNIIVYLKGGVHRLTSPMNFGLSDGGTNGDTICYRNAPGEKPIISGGRQVTGWSVHSGKIWKASVPGVTTKIRNMFVKGVRANMAKGQNVWGQGGWGTGSYSGTFDGVKFNASGSGPGKSVGVLNNPALVELRQVVHMAFGENTYCVREIATDQGYTVFKMQEPAWSNAQKNQQPQSWPGLIENDKCDPYYDGCEVQCGSTIAWWEKNEGFDLYNAYEFLDTAGEFYFDAPASMLYYIPRTGEDLSSADVEVALVEGLVNIKGNNLTSHVKNIQFWGITFENSEWLLMNQGGSYSASLGGVGGAVLWSWDGLDPTCTGVRPLVEHPTNTTIPAAINIESAEGIDLEWNVFRHTGASGISMKNDVLNSSIIGNLFYDIGAVGINIGHIGDLWIGDSSATTKKEYGPTREGMCKNIRVWNNLVYNNGKQYGGAAAIRSYNEVAVDISHNEVYNCPYSGIAMCYGYSFGPPNSGWKDCKINYNKVHDFMTRFDDGGGVYIEGTVATNCQMVENYFYNNTAVYRGALSCNIYLDGGTEGWLLQHNVAIFDRSNPDLNVIMENNDTELNTLVNNETQDKSVMDSAGLQGCYSKIADESLAAPQPGESPCSAGPITILSSMPASGVVKAQVVRAQIFDLRGRLLAASDRMSSLLRGRARPMSAGILVVKKEYAAGSSGRAVLAVVK